MLECSRRDASILRTALETTFSPTSRYPFVAFQVFYHLSDNAKTKYYRENKIRTEGEQITEISFPAEFQDLDTGVMIGNKESSLREFIFDYRPPGSSKNFVIDVDDASRSGITIMLVHNEFKTLAKQAISAWVPRKPPKQS